MKKAAFLGLLSALALPPLNLFPVLFICVPGLLGLIDGAPTRTRIFWLGYVFGFAHALGGIYWITEPILIAIDQYWWLIPFAAPLLAAALAFLVALPCLLAWHVRPGAARVATLAGGWVLANLAQQFLVTGFPWNPWGSSIELPGLAGTVLIQLAALIGIHGITLLVMLLAATPTLGWRGRGLGAAAMAAWIGFGLWRLDQPQPTPPGVKIVLVQGDVPEGQKRSRSGALDVFNRYLALSAQGLAQTGPGKRVLVWPETASPFLLAEDDGARAAIAAVAGPDTAALIGSVRYQGQSPRNSLVAMAPAPSIAAIYDKWHLVPFGEFQPSWFRGIQMLPVSFGFGPGPRSLHLPGLPAAGPLICYEAVFTGQIVDRADRPAWFVNITNDAWFGNTSGPLQHLASARMRAVEEGLPLLRAANTGVTGGFDAFGRELGRIPRNQPGVLVLALPGALPETPYAKGGLWVPLTGALLAVGIGLAGWDRRRWRRLNEVITNF